MGSDYHRRLLLLLLLLLLLGSDYHRRLLLLKISGIVLLLWLFDRYSFGRIVSRFCFSSSLDVDRFGFGFGRNVDSVCFCASFDVLYRRSRSSSSSSLIVVFVTGLIAKFNIGVVAADCASVSGERSSADGLSLAGFVCFRNDRQNVLIVSSNDSTIVVELVGGHFVLLKSCFVRVGVSVGLDVSQLLSHSDNFCLCHVRHVATCQRFATEKSPIYFDTRRV